MGSSALGSVASASPYFFIVPSNKMLKCLELFCGTKSVSKQAPGWEVISVDIEKKFEPTLCMSVLDIALDRWQPGHFHFIWASIPCAPYSNAHTRGTPDLENADLLSRHTLNLIKTLAPKVFVCENPATGKLRKRSFMSDIPWAEVSYCKYEPEWGYRKQTILFSNLWEKTSYRPETCKKDCLAMFNGRHRCSAQRGPLRPYASYPHDHSWKLEELYRIPPKLCSEIVRQVEECILREQLAANFRLDVSF